MNKRVTFRAPIERGIGGGAFVVVPFDVEAAFGAKRIKVKALIDGQPYRGSLVRMGGPGHILGVLKEIQARIGKSIGDEVEVVVEEDVEPRLVEAPADLKAALAADPAARQAYDRLSYTHQREYVRWIDEAKREPTRRERIDRTVDRLRQGEKQRQ